MSWMRKENDDIYDPSYSDMLRVAFTTEFRRGKLQDLVAVSTPNKKIDVVVWRDNSKKVISVVLGEWTEERVASVDETSPVKGEKTGSLLASIT